MFLKIQPDLFICHVLISFHDNYASLYEAGSWVCSNKSLHKHPLCPQPARSFLLALETQILHCLEASPSALCHIN